MLLGLCHADFFTLLFTLLSTIMAKLLVAIKSYLASKTSNVCYIDLNKYIQCL